MLLGDIVPLSETEHGLQRMLDTVNEWCKKWRLTLNGSKTKVIHFRPPSRPKSEFQFSCGYNAIAIDRSYKYLGFWFNEFLDLKYSVKEIVKSASRALGAVYTKYLHGGGMSYDVYTKLITTIVEPVLFYGAGIWGINTYKEVETVLNKACRYFLGVGKNASNLATRGDMGWSSCATKQKLECVRLWCRLKQMSAERITRRIYNWSCAIGKSWEKRMLNFISQSHLDNYMLVDNPSKKRCIREAKESLYESDKGKWFHDLFDDTY